jgi:iron(II)-dependent oxidoreductase
VRETGEDWRTWAQRLYEAHGWTEALVVDLSPEQLMGEPLPDLNPPVWEVGHVAWFYEFWVLRYQGEGRYRPSMLDRADELYNSSTVPRAERWTRPILGLADATGYLQRTTEAILSQLESESATEETRYLLEYALHHEYMHIESLWYTRQRLGYPLPPGFSPLPPPPNRPVPGPRDVSIDGGEFWLGASADAGFVFDNEKWAHPVIVEPFRISRYLVTNQEFLAFVESGGYRDWRLWLPQGWHWRQHAEAEHPLYWRFVPDEGWQMRHFDRWLPLAPEAPVMHVNWYEAEAYCRWARRRLPTEAEWELAASWDPESGQKRRHPWGEEAPDPTRANLGAWYLGPISVYALPGGDSALGLAQLVGQGWEWCADAFAPYPGFTPDPYREYSQPWFYTHRILRGGSWVTPPGLLRNTWRNYYLPWRREVFATFRTCAVD